jgi:hypothetical protein
VLLFEPGLPARCYIDRTGMSFEHLEASGTQTLCPYEGVRTRRAANMGSTVASPPENCLYLQECRCPQSDSNRHCADFKKGRAAFRG